MRHYTAEFKREAASLVLDQNDSQTEARELMNVSKSAMSQWVKQLKAERSGVTPQVGKALTAEHQEIQQLRATIARLEREKDILKKASALLMTESYHAVI